MTNSAYLSHLSFFLLSPLLSGADDQASLSEHHGVTLDFVAPAGMSAFKYLGKGHEGTYISNRVVTTTNGTAIFQKYLRQLETHRPEPLSGNSRVAVVDSSKIFEVHPKVTLTTRCPRSASERLFRRRKTHGQESQRQIKTGDNCQLLHALVLVGANGVENKINHVVGSTPHLIISFHNSNTMIQSIAEVGMAHGANADARAAHALQVRRHDADV
jgi:hypothetical protein